MEGRGGVHTGIFQQTVLDEELGPRAQLLAGLEHQLDPASQLGLVLLQHLRRPQEDGGVHVVAAGVHAAVGGAEGQLVLLRHPKGVHVRPEEEGLLPLPQDHGPAAGAHRLGLQPQLGQAVPDVGRGVGQVQPHLRDLMEGPAVGPHLVRQALRALIQVFQHHTLSPFPCLADDRPS